MSTPDERFLQKLHALALQKGDAHAPIEIRHVANAISLKETAAKNIVKHLAQANFLKKLGETRVSLTPRGLAFVQEHTS